MMERLARKQRTNTALSEWYTQFMRVATEEQIHRFEQCKRSKLPRAAMRRMMQELVGNSTERCAIVLMTIGKMFVGELTESARADMTDAGETGPITADSIRTHWGNFTVSMEFQSMCKCMCLQDTTCKGKCTESLFYEMRPLGKGAFGAVFLVFKYDTGVGFATKKMMKKIVKKNGAVAHPALEPAAPAQRSPDGRRCQRGRQPCTSRRC